MRWVRCIALIALMSAGCLSVAAPTDRQLYEAYLKGEMDEWVRYIDGVNQETSNAKERERVLVYEYGLVPYLWSIGDTAACRKANQRYKVHIARAKGWLKEADYLAHISASAIYSFLLKEVGLSGAVNGMQYSKAALQADSVSPLALYMRGNVYFHYPRIAGGNKKKALACYQRAEKIMENDTSYRYHWMYAAVQLVVAQCYDKTGEKEKAIEQCCKILRLHPQFAYVKTYLPTLSEKEKNGKD